MWNNEEFCNQQYARGWHLHNHVWNGQTMWCLSRGFKRKLPWYIESAMYTTRRHFYVPWNHATRRGLWFPLSNWIAFEERENQSKFINRNSGLQDIYWLLISYDKSVYQQIMAQYLVNDKPVIQRRMIWSETHARDSVVPTHLAIFRQVVYKSAECSHSCIPEGDFQSLLQSYKWLPTKFYRTAKVRLLERCLWGFCLVRCTCLIETILFPLLYAIVKFVTKRSVPSGIRTRLYFKTKLNPGNPLAKIYKCHWHVSTQEDWGNMA